MQECAAANTREPRGLSGEPQIFGKGMLWFHVRTRLMLTRSVTIFQHPDSAGALAYTRLGSWYVTVSLCKLTHRSGACRPGRREPLEPSISRGDDPETKETETLGSAEALCTELTTKHSHKHTNFSLVALPPPQLELQLASEIWWPFRCFIRSNAFAWKHIHINTVESAYTLLILLNLLNSTFEMRPDRDTERKDFQPYVISCCCIQYHPIVSLQTHNIFLKDSTEGMSLTFVVFL